MITAISWFFVAAFVLSAIMTFRAQLRFERLLRAQGASVFGDDLVEQPWRFWQNLRLYLSQALSAPYQRQTGEVEEARRGYLGWRWAMVSSFVAMLVTSAIAAFL